MSDNVENIESKLCAYVDGQLVGAEREEIERHLDANPAHRGLIEELRRQRFYLRALPREKAPADMLENLQSQLERSALLDGEELGAHEPILRIGRWSQVFSAAAIVILTAGVAFVVYTMLPPRGGSPEIVFNPGLSKVPAGNSQGLANNKSTDGVTGNVLRKGGEGLGGGGNGGRGNTDAYARQVVEFFDAGLDDDTMVITVRSDDPRLASAQVTGFLGANAIDFAQSADQPTAIDALRQVLGEARSEAATRNLASQQSVQEQLAIRPQEKFADLDNDLSLAKGAEVARGNIPPKPAGKSDNAALKPAANKPAPLAEDRPPAVRPVDPANQPPAKAAVAQDILADNGAALAGAGVRDRAASNGQVILARGLSQTQLSSTSSLGTSSGYRTSLRRTTPAELKQVAPAASADAKAGPAPAPIATEALSAEGLISALEDPLFWRRSLKPQTRSAEDASFGVAQKESAAEKLRSPARAESEGADRFVPSSFGRQSRAYNAVIIVTPPQPAPAEPAKTAAPTPATRPAP